MQTEMRKEERKPANGIFRVYTNLTCCAYTVQLKDVSKNGAFIRHKHLPQIGDIITYAALDSYGRQKQTGNAKVVRVQAQGTDEEVGFAIEMENDLDDDVINMLVH